MKGSIIITLEGVTLEETERCRKIIHTLFEQGVFNLRRGDVVLSFDERGELGSIRLDYVRWRRDKPAPAVKLLEQYLVEMAPLDKSTVTHKITI